MSEFETRLDHLVVGALSLSEGADFVERCLGVTVPDGGRHDFMATRNKVMTLGGGVYLEIVAVDPETVAPAHPRWFGLDDPAVIHSLARSPRLLTWAVNTTNLEALSANSKLTLGKIQQAQRDDLCWRVALSDDGRLTASGFMPLCIEWQTEFHPSAKMADLNCRFEGLTFNHSRPEWLHGVLESIGAAELVTITPISDQQPCSMEARIRTRDGSRSISSIL